MRSVLLLVAVLAVPASSHAGDALEPVPQVGHRTWIRAVAVSANGQWVVTGDDSGKVMLWDASGRAVRTFSLDREVEWVGVDPDGTRVLTSTRGEKAIDVRDAVTGRTRFTLAERDLGYPSAMSLSADGRRLLVGALSGKLVSWNLDEKSSRTAVHLPDRITPLALSPDGATIATAGHADEVDVWDLGTGRKRFRLAGHPDGPRFVGFAPDGKAIVTLATPSSKSVVKNGRTESAQPVEPTLRVWDAATGTAVRTVQVPCVGWPTARFTAANRVTVVGRGGASEVDIQAGTVRQVRSRRPFFKYWTSVRTGRE